MISIKDMHKIYSMGAGEVAALDGVSAEISEGEFTAIIGPSGSGKSTLMNMIGCLDVPTSGSYSLGGEEVSVLSDNALASIRNRRIGFIFQGFNLLPKLNAFENVELPMIYRKIPHADRRRMTEEALSLVGLGERMHHRPSELSGGQQQRVAIARAIAGNPSIILADEPTGALDSRSGEEILGILKKLNATGATIIIITHDPRIAARATRVIKLLDGKVIFDGPSEMGAQA